MTKTANLKTRSYERLVLEERLAERMANHARGLMRSSSPPSTHLNEWKHLSAVGRHTWLELAEQVVDEVLAAHAPTGKEG